MASIKCGSCKGRHETIAQVRLCYARKQHREVSDNEMINEHWVDMKQQSAQREEEQERQAYMDKMARDEELAAGSLLDSMTGRPGRDLASDAQARYVMDLLADREWPDTLTEDAVRNMERRQVSKLIDALKGAPRKESAGLEAGIYRMSDGRIIRVYLGQKSGRMLAKELVFVCVEQSSASDIEKGLPLTWERWKYVYLGAADKHARGGRKLSQEEAREWGKRSSTCVACGRRLDVPESVDAGIGPVCAKKDSWAGVAA